MITNVWYLYHSGYAIKINNKVLIFDYYLDEPLDKSREKSFDNGVVNPNEIKDCDVYVLSSHNHSDHYQECILEWKNIIPKITYILSDDIEKPDIENVYSIAPHQSLNIDGMKIYTLLSNDCGVAFVVEVDGVCIYFSGDLNWWHWVEESDEWNQGIEQVFKQELIYLQDYNIDIAFIPVDPRLEASYSKSLDYFLSTVATSNTHIFPMHFGTNYSVFEDLRNDGYLNNDKLYTLTRRGDRFDITIDK